jgi:hypothetical protein
MTEDKSNDRADFIKLICDFTKDVLTTFPEQADTLEENLRLVVTAEDLSQIDKAVVNELFDKCKEVYPPRFFDILYQNNEIFDKEHEEDTHFLPGIDFRELWSLDISEQTRKTVWKYLQLVLLRVVSELEHDNTFGDTAKLFEAIDEEALKTKLEQTVKDMEEMFGQMKTDGTDSSIPAFDPSFISQDDLPNPEDIHNHLTGLLKGKLGRLAQEIAEETAKELGSDFDDMANVSSADAAFKKLFKNPGKLMSLVKKVGGKLEDKIKSGEIKESELLQEAGEFMSKMNSMPGMGNLKNVLGQMGMPGLGKDVKLNMGALNTMMRGAQTRDRLRAKLAKKQQERESGIATEPVTKTFSTGEKVERSKKGDNVEQGQSTKTKSKKSKNKKKK